jgi:hypothetical protein
MGFFRSLLSSLTESQTPKRGTGSAWHGPGGKNAVESKLRSNPSDIGVKFRERLTGLKALYRSQD